MTVKPWSQLEHNFAFLCLLESRDQGFTVIQLVASQVHALQIRKTLQTLGEGRECMVRDEVVSQTEDFSLKPHLADRLKSCIVDLVHREIQHADLASDTLLDYCHCPFILQVQSSQS